MHHILPVEPAPLSCIVEAFTMPASDGRSRIALSGTRGADALPRISNASEDKTSFRGSYTSCTPAEHVTSGIDVAFGGMIFATLGDVGREAGHANTSYDTSFSASEAVAVPTIQAVAVSAPEMPACSRYLLPMTEATWLDADSCYALPTAAAISASLRRSAGARFEAVSCPETSELGSNFDAAASSAIRPVRRSSLRALPLPSLSTRTTRMGAGVTPPLESPEVLSAASDWCKIVAAAATSHQSKGACMELLIYENSDTDAWMSSASYHPLFAMEMSDAIDTLP